MNKIYLIGDSTCQNNKEDTYPQTGWGQVFNQYLKDEFEVINLAKNGRSSKSFYDEGLFTPCLNNITEGDLLFIQFGHNDEKEDEARHTEPYTTYQKYLKYYIDVAKKAKATPILLSSIYRRKFDENDKIIENCHLQYPEAMKDLALHENVIFIDMCSVTKDYLQQLGDEKSKELFMNFPANIYSNYMEGKQDDTHLRLKGATAICELLVEQILKIECIKYIIK